MTKTEWEELGVQRFGLPDDLFVPIAAADLQAIETCVGTIEERLRGRKRPVNAVVVSPKRPVRNGSVPLWEQLKADHYYERLHPQQQLWVHVDYRGYRGAWHRLGFPELGREMVLDHIKNRASVRLSGYRYPFLRLCPVSMATNTNSGVDSGAEGLEKAEVRRRRQRPLDPQSRAARALAAPIILADPVDLTKMLDMPPGLSVLKGVGDALAMFYPRSG